MAAPPPRRGGHGPPPRRGAPHRGPPRGGPPSRPPGGRTSGGPPSGRPSGGPPSIPSSNSRGNIGPPSGGPRRTSGPPPSPAVEPPSQPVEQPAPSRPGPSPTGPPPSLPSNPPPSKPAPSPTSSGPPATERKQPEEKKQAEPVIVARDISVAQAASEFLEGERQYVEDSLRTTYEVFLNRLQVHSELNKEILNDTQIHQIFGSLFTLYTVNQKLYSDLMNLRLQGEEVLIENLGVVMRDFIPHFRMYTDYITKCSDGVALAESIKGKKWKEFLEINEKIAGRTLKSLLQQPTIRIAQYLKDLAGLYTAHQREGSSETSAAMAVFEAINEIQNVTEDITQKVRDKKQRRLLGTLQKKIFSDKIQLIASHRYVVKQGELQMIRKANVQSFHFILCNDILVIGSLPTRWAAGTLVSVFPLIGLRCVPQPHTDSDQERDFEYRFAVIPQNKNFTPEDATPGGSVVALAPNQKTMNSWVRTIENTVVDEEHNLRPCNPVDLEKRLRRERTSPEGAQETIQIRDPERIAEIEQWKAAGKPRRVRTSSAIQSNNAHAAAAALSGPSRGPPRPGSGPSERVAPASAAPSGPPPAAPGSGPSGPPPAAPAAEPAVPKRNSRAALLAGIRGGMKLKKAAATEERPAPAAAAAPPGDMNALLRGTLNKYRQFVVDDDDADSDDDDDWE